MRGGSSGSRVLVRGCRRRRGVIDGALRANAFDGSAVAVDGVPVAVERGALAPETVLAVGGGDGLRGRARRAPFSLAEDFRTVYHAFPAVKLLVGGGVGEGVGVRGREGRVIHIQNVNNCTSTF